MSRPGASSPRTVLQEATGRPGPAAAFPGAFAGLAGERGRPAAAQPTCRAPAGMPPAEPPGGAAIYLRCYPADYWQMVHHRDVLCHYAHLVGLAEPLVFLDNGRRPPGLPALDRLMRLIAGGLVATVLVTGPFVFSVHDTEAQAAMKLITGAGGRVLELLPHHH
ncbi:hypothetical protein [Streptomyces avermitilis]|uniref:hypothetical protein n=1 Tax=Streptomyces avermitilis TaxID=33903 RepID=UPI0037104D5E